MNMRDLELMGIDWSGETINLSRSPLTLIIRRCNRCWPVTWTITPIGIRLHTTPKSMKVGICTINYKGYDFLLFKWVIKFFLILLSIRCSSIFKSLCSSKVLMSKLGVFRIYLRFGISILLTCVILRLSIPQPLYNLHGLSGNLVFIHKYLSINKRVIH